MTSIRTFTAPIFSAAAAFVLTLALVGGTVNSPAQNPLTVAPATSSSVYSA